MVLRRSAAKSLLLCGETQGKALSEAFPVGLFTDKHLPTQLYEAKQENATTNTKYIFLTLNPWL